MLKFSKGKGTQQQQDVVALNPALALYVGEVIGDRDNYFQTFADGVVLGKDAMKNGEPWRKLEQLAGFLK